MRPGVDFCAVLRGYQERGRARKVGNSVQTRPGKLWNAKDEDAVNSVGGAGEVP